MTTDTTVWGSFEPTLPLPLPGLAAADAMLCGDADSTSFRIRAADSAGRRSSANILIERMYAWRGYRGAALPARQTAQRVTLTASEHDETIGTITIGLDSPEGIYADDAFHEEIDGLRRSGRRICEFTKLAVDSSTRSKRVLASLFHVAYIYAHRIKRADVLVIEVNPRHVRYYRAMLGCSVLAEERLNRRVNAPAVLLALEFSHIREQIARLGGRPELFSAERSLYPHSFSAEEEEGIIARLRRSAWGDTSTVASRCARSRRECEASDLMKLEAAHQRENLEPSLAEGQWLLGENLERGIRQALFEEHQATSGVVSP